MPTVVTPVDVAHATTGSWADIDITSYVGADAGSVALAHLRIQNGTGSTNDFGIRPNGSTDDEKMDVANGGWADIAIPVDSSDIFEMYQQATGFVVYLWGYSTTAEAEGLTDGYNFDSVLTLNTWTDVDISGQFTGTAEIAFGLATDTAFSNTDESFRPDGATDDLDSTNAGDGPQSNGSLAWKPFTIPCVSEIFECNSGDPTDRDHFVYGVITDGSICKKNVNVTSNALTGTHDDGGGALNGTWVDSLDVTAYVDTGDPWLLYCVYSTVGANMGKGIRPQDSTLDHHMSNANSRSMWGMMPMTSGDLIDGYAADSGQPTAPRVAFGVYGSIAATPTGGGPAPVFRRLMLMGVGR